MLLDSLNSEMQIVDSLRNSLKTVVTLPLYPPTQENIVDNFPTLENIRFKRPNIYGNYYTNGGDCLGVVGKSFSVTQPKDLFDAFVRSLIESGKFDLNTLKVLELKGGSKIRFTISAEPISFKNKAKKVDDIETRIVLETGFDGRTKTSLSIETLRLVCTNGMTVKDSVSTLAIKNTLGNKGKIIIATNSILRYSQSVRDYKEQLLKFDATAVSSKDVDMFITNLLGYSPKDRASLEKRQILRLDAFQESLNLEFSRTGATVWGLLNGATHYTNHVASKDKDSYEYVTVGSGKAFNDKSQALAVSLLK